MHSLFVLTHRIHLLLAYLTNPSEASFRSYLTEQCFRHHLSRLDDSTDGDHSDSEDSGVHYSLSSSSHDSSHSGQQSSRSHHIDSPSSFHFSSRASVALRTPKHAFHSFAFFTIAAVIPNPKPSTTRASSASNTDSAAADHEGGSPAPKETWFLGAFGRWWRGGVVVEPTWPRSRSLRAKCHEEGWSSGILNVKALDKLDGYSGKRFVSVCMRYVRSTDR